MIVQVKENQKQLFEDCQWQAKFSPTEVSNEEAAKAHGRLETRKVEVYSNFQSTEESWHSLVEDMVRVIRKREIFDTKTKQWKESQEISFYISTKNYSAKKYANFIRNHWAIENRLHYVKDVSMNEDASRIRKNPQNMGVLRSWSLNLLRRKKVVNVAQTLYENALDWEQALQYVY